MRLLKQNVITASPLDRHTGYTTPNTANLQPLRSQSTTAFTAAGVAKHSTVSSVSSNARRASVPVSK